MDNPELARVKELHEVLQPTRWVLLRRAATRPLVHAAEALKLAQEEAGFSGSESTARFHATWLQKRGYFETLEHNGLVAYRITSRGRQVYDHVVAIAGGAAEPIRPRTESHLVALVASVVPSEYDLLTGDGGLDLSVDLTRGLESVLTARARIHVQPT